VQQAEQEARVLDLEREVQLALEKYLSADKSSKLTARNGYRAQFRQFTDFVLAGCGKTAGFG